MSKNFFKRVLTFSISLMAFQLIGASGTRECSGSLR